MPKVDRPAMAPPVDPSVVTRPARGEYTMAHAATGVRAAGITLAVASVLLAGALALHGPLAPTLEQQMGVIAGSATRWAVVHWIAAVALSMFAVAGLVVLSSGSRLTANPWTMTAWAVVPVGALWTASTAVAEVTVIADAAVARNMDLFASWWAFAEGKAAGFTFLALAVAVVAGHEARTRQSLTPVWASSVAAVAGIASFVGWALGVWLGFRPGSLLWVVSSGVMCLWTLWFGVSLAGSAAALPRSTAADRGRQAAAHPA